MNSSTVQVLVSMQVTVLLLYYIIAVHTYTVSCFIFFHLLCYLPVPTTCLDRFLIYVPKVVAPSLKCSANCLPLKVQEDTRKDLLGSQLSAPCEVLHPMATKQCFLFPETRLIQYDCGELADSCYQTCMHVCTWICLHLLFSLFQANCRLWILYYRNLRVKATGQPVHICNSVEELYLIFVLIA